MASVDPLVALITLANLKEYLKISNATEDSVLGAFINECSQASIDFMGRQIIQKTYTEFYDGSGTDEMLLDKHPIVSITQLNDDTERAFNAGNDIDIAADVLLNKEQGSVRLWNNEGGFVAGKANVKVVYVAGYLIADVPASIKLAVKRWIGTHYMKHVRRRHDIGSETVRDKTTSFIVDDIPADVKNLLVQFRKYGSVGEFFSG